MRKALLLLTIAAAALAQEPAVAPTAQAGATIPSGVPLRVALDRQVPIKHVGDPIQGQLVEPVYIFDRVALPAGARVEGHIAAIGGVPAGRRLKAILSGNFTPAREVRAQFDSVILNDGSRLALRTAYSRGTAYTTHVGKQRRQGRAFMGPSKMSRLKSSLFGMLPYRRQAWSAGTRFSAVLQDPLTGIATSPVEAQSAEAGAQEVSARLLVSLSSATAQRGSPVEAVVTEPLFSPDQHLLIPEGSTLHGDVVEAQPARSLHRNGKLLFVFREIQLPGGSVQGIQGYLESLEADFDAHLALDSEGTTRASSPKTRFIFPALAVAVAGLSLHQDYNAQGIPDQDFAGRAESGAVGLGLIGTVLAQTSRTLASSIAFTGAGFSVYTNFVGRGQDVVLPENTLVKVSLKPRGGVQK